MTIEAKVFSSNRSTDNGSFQFTIPDNEAVHMLVGLNSPRFIGIEDKSDESGELGGVLEISFNNHNPLQVQGRVIEYKPVLRDEGRQTLMQYKWPKGGTLMIIDGSGQKGEKMIFTHKQQTYAEGKN